MGFSGSTEDRLAIHELVMSYGDAVTRLDAQAWGETWAENATWRIPSFPGLELTEGKQTIVKNWSGAMEGFKQIVFTATLGSLTVEGDSASGICYSQELITDLEEVKSMVAGRYDDEFVKLDGRWYFQNRTYTPLDIR
jgi:ketosteroid isomerase-like protein